MKNTVAHRKKHSKSPKNKTIKMKRRHGRLYFSDFPEFRPNLSPREMFELGSFGGTYWRPIYSAVTKKSYKHIHKKYPFLENLPEDTMSSVNYDNAKNKYQVKVGTSLDFWEGKNWITKYHPYGWVHWYCDFCMGRRCADDERQIRRWLGLAGSKGRFQRFLVTQILKKKGLWNDEMISPKIRQVLQHWAYYLTKSDFDEEVKRRKTL